MQSKKNTNLEYQKHKSNYLKSKKPSLLIKKIREKVSQKIISLHTQNLIFPIRFIQIRLYSKKVIQKNILICQILFIMILTGTYIQIQKQMSLMINNIGNLDIILDFQKTKLEIIVSLKIIGLSLDFQRNKLLNSQIVVVRKQQKLFQNLTL